MADEVQFDLVSPERRVASRKVTSVQIPGLDGELTAMANHAPVITALKPGIMRVDGPDGEVDYVVTGGFAEIAPDVITILAERALVRSEMTQEDFDSIVEEARTLYKKAQEEFENEPGPVDDAAKLLSDMVSIGDNLGFSTKQ